MSLTLPEFHLAVQTAMIRIVASASQHLNHANALISRGLLKRLKDEVVGACGELAVAKWSGQFFVPSVNTFHRLPDCLEDVEVRATDFAGGCLIVRDNDAGDRRFVLAIVRDDLEVTLAGWIWGGEAKAQEFWSNPNGKKAAFFVPQERLWSMDTFWNGEVPF